MKSHASTISMSEIEIWFREDPSEVQQKPYYNGDGAAYLLPEDDNKSVYEFSKVGYKVTEKLFSFKPA